VKYWDSSAIVPALGAQADGEERAALLKQDRDVTTWWGTRVECSAAVYRLRREEMIDERGLTQMLRRFESFFETCVEIEATEEVKARAIRLLRAHPLRAADALQLAAALVACREEPGSLPFVSSDQRLKSAAEKEGFTVF
jgi:predicted nucleic acid-binding protein